jgi:hypothetical protein
MAYEFTEAQLDSIRDAVNKWGQSPFILYSSGEII